MILAFLDPKVVLKPSILWIVGSGILVVIGTVTKIMTRNHIHRKEAYKDFQTAKFCNERAGNIEEKLDNLKEHITERFDDLKDLINRK